jgi:WD40 repeat protein
MQTEDDATTDGTEDDATDENEGTPHGGIAGEDSQSDGHHDSKTVKNVIRDSLSVVPHSRRSHKYESDCLISSITNWYGKKTSVSWVVPSKTFVCSSYDGCIYWRVINDQRGKSIEHCVSLTDTIPPEIDAMRKKTDFPDLKSAKSFVRPAIEGHMNHGEIRHPFQTGKESYSGKLKYIADKIVHEYELTITCEGKLHLEWLYDHNVEIIDEGSGNSLQSVFPSALMSGAISEHIGEDIDQYTCFCNTCSRFIHPSTIFTGPRLNQTQERKTKLNNSREMVDMKRNAMVFMETIRNHKLSHSSFDINPSENAFSIVRVMNNFEKCKEGFDLLKHQYDKIQNGQQHVLESWKEKVDSIREYAQKHIAFKKQKDAAANALKAMEKCTDQSRFDEKLAVVKMVYESLQLLRKNNQHEAYEDETRRLQGVIQQMAKDLLKRIDNNLKAMHKDIPMRSDLEAIQYNAELAISQSQALSEHEELQKIIQSLKQDDKETADLIKTYMNNKESMEAKIARIAGVKNYIADSVKYMQGIVDRFDAVPDSERRHNFESRYSIVLKQLHDATEYNEDAIHEDEEDNLILYKTEVMKCRSVAVDAAMQAGVMDTGEQVESDDDDNEGSELPWNAVGAKNNRNKNKKKNPTQQVLQPNFKSKLHTLQDSRTQNHNHQPEKEKELEDNRNMKRVREYELTFLCCGAVVQNTRIERINRLPLDIHGNPFPSAQSSVAQASRMPRDGAWGTEEECIKTGMGGVNWADEMDSDDDSNEHFSVETSESVALRRSKDLVTYKVRFKSATIGGLHMCYTTTRGHSLQFRHIKILSIDDVQIVSAAPADSREFYKNYLLSENSLTQDSRMVEGGGNNDVHQCGNHTTKTEQERYTLSRMFFWMAKEEEQLLLATPVELRESVERPSEEQRRLPLEHVCVSRDGTRFAACAWNGRCIIYSPSSTVLRDLCINVPENGTISGEQDDILVLRGHVGEVAHAAWAPKDQFIATASTDCTVRLWNPLNGRQLLIMNGHSNALRTIAWSEDGSYLASGGDDGVINACSMGSWMRFASHADDLSGKLPPGKNPLNGCRYLGNGKSGAVICLAWSPLRNFLAAGYHDGCAVVWNVERKEVLFEFKEEIKDVIINGKKTQYRDPSATHVHAISWHPDEKFIVTGGGDDRAVNLWHVHRGTELVYATEPGDLISSIKNGHTEQIWGIDVNSDGKMIVTCGEDSDVNIFNTGILTTGFGRNVDINREIEYEGKPEQRRENYTHFVGSRGKNKGKSLSKRRERLLQLEREKNEKMQKESM